MAKRESQDDDYFERVEVEEAKEAKENSPPKNSTRLNLNKFSKYFKPLKPKVRYGSVTFAKETSSN